MGEKLPLQGGDVSPRGPVPRTRGEPRRRWPEDAISCRTRSETHPANKRMKRCRPGQKPGKHTEATETGATAQAGWGRAPLTPRGLAPWRTQTRAAECGSGPSPGRGGAGWGGTDRAEQRSPPSRAGHGLRPETRPAATLRGICVPVLDEAVALRRPDVTMKPQAKDPRHTATPCLSLRRESPPQAAEGGCPRCGRGWGGSGGVSPRGRWSPEQDTGLRGVAVSRTRPGLRTDDFCPSP